MNPEKAVLKYITEEGRAGRDPIYPLKFSFPIIARDERYLGIGERNALIILNHFPGRIKNTYGFHISDLFDPDLDDAEFIKILLGNTRCYPSLTSNGTVFCPANKFRSSLDIWRHAQYFRPDIHIFDVMRLLHKICREDDPRLPLLYGQFCSFVQRRVFKFSIHNLPSWGVLSGIDEVDEYGLTFSQWENIGL